MKETGPLPQARPEPLDAKSVLAQLAADPSLDEFFARCPPLSEAEARDMIAKLRAERASWGSGKPSNVKE